MLEYQVIIPREEITHFCHKWNVMELALFGSILRKDFNVNSDVDVLISFSSQSHHSLLDLAQMQLELERAFGRSVDLIEKNSVKNPYRKNAILENSEVIFAADR